MRAKSLLLGLALGIAGCGLPGADEESDSDAETESQARSAVQAAGCVPEQHIDQHALCICDDLSGVGRVTTRRSVHGESSIAANGAIFLVSETTIEGSVLAYRGFDSVSDALIEGDLSSAFDVSSVGKLEVGGNLQAGGDLSSVGGLTISGTAGVAGEVSVVGEQSIASWGSYDTQAAPCGCSGDNYFDVATAVADAALNNNNVEVGLDTEGARTAGTTELSLPSGRYYIKATELVGNTTITAAGQVALFVDGSLDLVGDSQLTIAEGGSLDLYVAGDVSSVGALSAGAPDKPFRLLVGGNESVLLAVGEQTFYGEIYAPSAAIELVGDTLVVGALFAKSLDGVGELTLENGGLFSTPPATCLPPEDQAEPPVAELPQPTPH